MEERGAPLMRQKFYLPSTENASRTLPGAPPGMEYPELKKTIPSTMTGPGPLIAPPLAGTPSTVW